MAVFVIPSSLYWSSPLLALIAAWRLSARTDRLFASTRRDRLIMVLSGFILGAVGTVRLYISLFWEIENFTIPAARLPALCLPWILVGPVLGAMLVLVRHRTHQRSLASSPEGRHEGRAAS